MTGEWCLNKVKFGKSSLNCDYNLMEVFKEFKMKKSFIKVFLRVAIKNFKIFD